MSMSIRLQLPWAVSLICLLQFANAEVRIHETCGQLATSSIPINVYIQEANLQEYIQSQPDNYRAQLGLAASSNTRVSFGTETVSEYPVLEYFSLVEGARTDNIRGQEWFVQMKKPIDKESGVNVLEYIIQCSDESTSYNMPLRIKITDVNEFSPEFKMNSFDTTVSENTQTGTVVLTVSARDEDAEDNAISYYLEYVTTPEKCPFSISTESGEITVSASLLDSEVASCTLTVSAKDGGTPQRSSMAQIRINIQRDDKQAPSFVYPGCVEDDRGLCIHPVYTTTIPLGWTGNPTLYTIPAGSTAGLIQAQVNEGSGLLNFNIEIAGGYEEHFNLTVKPASGDIYSREITLTRPLSVIQNFILTVKVKEESSTAPSATALVYVTVTSDEQPPSTSSTTSTTTSDTVSGPAQDTGSMNVEAIALGSVAAVLLVVIVILILYILRLRRSSKEESYAHLSANRQPSRTYNVISKTRGDNSQEANGGTIEPPSVTEPGKNPNNPKKLTASPSGDYEVPDGTYVDIVE